jgi:2,5-diketo-D-gluconate reductase A
VSTVLVVGATGSPASWRLAAPGFGHYQIRLEQTEQAVSAALAAGYRHLDTARGLLQRGSRGEALRSSGAPRSS